MLGQLEMEVEGNDLTLPYMPSHRIEAFYQHWVRKRNLPVRRVPESIPPRISTVFPGGGQDPSDNVYEDLLDLMIYSEQQDVESGFQQVLFKKWQETDFWAYIWPIPALEIVDEAFKNLPSDHFLLKHLVRFYSCLWETDKWGSIEEYKPRGPGFEKFLFGVCWQRLVIFVLRCNC